MKDIAKKSASASPREKETKDKKRKKLTREERQGEKRVFIPQSNIL